MSNAAAGNAVLTFFRLPDGRLVPAGSTPTGGHGSGSGLGNQGGLVLTQNERWLLAVNAGSDTVTVFEVGHLGLRRRDVQPSGGSQPISIATHRNLVYVLNALSDSIAGFRLTKHGTLEPHSRIDAFAQRNWCRAGADLIYAGRRRAGRHRKEHQQDRDVCRGLRRARGRRFKCTRRPA